MALNRYTIVKEYLETIEHIQATLRDMTTAKDTHPYVKFVDQIGKLDVLAKLGMKLVSLGKALAHIEGKSSKETEKLGARLQGAIEAARETVRGELSIEETTYRTTAVPSIVMEIVQVVAASLALEDFGSQSVESLYDSLRLHPRIRKVSESLFRTRHYAQAIFEAFKCIEVMVKEKSGIDNQDGQTLMAHVFDETRPTLRINPLQTTSEKDEQIGFKFIFMGAMTGIRNPKAHDIIEQRDPYRTLEYLQLVSLLAKRVDEATRTQTNAR
jgi:uncharacterized protein (TIGR02391 family)